MQIQPKRPALAGSQRRGCRLFSARASPQLFRRLARNTHRIIGEWGREPFLADGEAPAFAPGVILDLIAVDAPDAEIGALRMRKIQSANRRPGPHGEAFGELHADRRFRAEQLEYRPL